jgi:hypothetical protein
VIIVSPGGLEGWLKPDGGVAVRVSSSRLQAQGVRCSYCHDDQDPETWAPCPGCQTLLHRDCAKDAGVCPTLGCTFKDTVRIQVARGEPTGWARTRRILGGVVLPLVAFGANESIEVSEMLHRFVGDSVPSVLSNLYAADAQRAFYPFLLACMVAFVLAERGHRSPWIHAGLVAGNALAFLFVLAYLPVLHLAVVGVLLLGLGLLGFTPLLALGSYGFALGRYLKASSAEEELQDRVNRLGPWA